MSSMRLEIGNLCRHVTGKCMFLITEKDTYLNKNEKKQIMPCHEHNQEGPSIPPNTSPYASNIKVEI